MKETKQFQAETKRLLDLMIHSIYTHKEIFLRELISNANDAMDKIKFKSLTEDGVKINDEDLKIFIEADEEKRTITIHDGGIGMTKDEVIENIGTIAKSGSKDFVEKLKEAKENQDLDIIGQFGVGFYSAFMVADKVTLITKSAFSDMGVKWESNGDGEYIIEDVSKEKAGTSITLHLREDEEGNSFSEYAKEWHIRELVKKYSDYVRYPIQMDIEREVSENPEDENSPKIKEVTTETLNSQKPLWRKNKDDITDEEYSDFYKSKFHDWTAPLKPIHFKVEGNIEYTALLYIPKKAPMDFYSKEFEKGLQLYCKNVFIMDKCKELLPDHFRFVKGLVDSADFSLNISREILQQDRQLKVIAKNLEKKIARELENTLKNERETYKEFFKEFGSNIKYGIYDGFGAKKDLLKNLLIFETSANEDMTTLKEYVDRMGALQEDIYFVSGENREQLLKLPQMEAVLEKGYEVLLFTDKVDEFAIQVLAEYEGKKFKSINQGDFNLDENNEVAKKEIENKEKDNKDLIDKIQKSLEGKVSKVKLTSRLKSSAVCLVSGEGISFEMEKAMADMPASPMGPVKAERILEINPDHDLFKALQNLDQKGEDISLYSDVLYSQALLIEGFKLDDPIDFANKMSDLIIKAAK